MGPINDTLICWDEGDIAALRAEHWNGLHFVVGDTHGESETLKALMNKIGFDPEKDHAYFVGDYNAGPNVRQLLSYISEYYRPDFAQPGFHLIRGNHEHELGPLFPLENLPDVIVIKGKNINFHIVHAGMDAKAFSLINADLAEHPDEPVTAYKLDECCVCFDAPLRQMTWSMRGLYSQRSHWHVWPSESELYKNRACIVHGHSPFCFFVHDDGFSYGEDSVFWEKQHIFFSQSLQSFNLDANVKGRRQNGQSYRGLACICLEVFDSAAAKNFGWLDREAVIAAENGVFGVPLGAGWGTGSDRIDERLFASPKMRTITLDANGKPCIADG